MSRAFALAALLAALPAWAEARQRLGVLVVFDQMPSADLDRLEPLFGPGGFGGLMGAGGARYDALYDYAATDTGPGHATLVTGANPSVHGIVLNRWVVAGKTVYCVDDPRGEVLFAPPDAPRMGPAQLRATTLGDVLKIDTQGRGRVVTLSLKDRAAILTAGRAADLALWYDEKAGRFTSSKAYVEALPAWAEKLAVDLPQKSFATGTWSPLPFPEGFEGLVPDDDRPGEGPPEGVARTFPHDLAALADDAQKRSWYRNTPQSVSDLFALADAAIDEEKLGQDVVPDLLVLSISTTDYVGHHFGPDSLEAVDVLRRAHMELRQFVAGLERRFGRRGFALALSSDHGSTPPAEIVGAARVPVYRVARSAVKDAIDAAIAAALPKDPKNKARFLRTQEPDVFLDLDGLTPIERETAIEAARRAVEVIPGVASTLRADKPDARPDPYLPLYVNGWYPGRSGAFQVRLVPRATFRYDATSLGTDHGTPYVYDRRVPVFIVGGDVKRGRSTYAADPRDVAPTLSYLLRISPPDQATGKPLPAVGD